MLIDNLKAVIHQKEPKEFRKFGLTIGIFLLLVGLLLMYLSSDITYYFIVGGSVFTGLAFLFPVLLRPFFVIWMAFGTVMGFFMTRVLLIFIYFLIFTPIGFFLRIFNVKLLDEKIDTNQKSYWIKKDAGIYNPASSEKQY